MDIMAWITERFDRLKDLQDLLVIYLFYVTFFKSNITPIGRWFRKRHAEGQVKNLNEALEQSGLMKKLDSTFQSNESLQRYILSSAYAKYVHRLRFCPASEKECLLRIFDEYTESGKNHLIKTYKEDIEELPVLSPQYTQQFNRSKEEL